MSDYEDEGYAAYHQHAPLTQHYADWNRGWIIASDE